MKSKCQNANFSRCRNVATPHRNVTVSHSIEDCSPTSQRGQDLKPRSAPTRRNVRSRSHDVASLQQQHFALHIATWQRHVQPNTNFCPFSACSREAYKGNTIRACSREAYKGNMIRAWKNKSLGLETLGHNSLEGKF